VLSCLLAYRTLRNSRLISGTTAEHSGYIVRIFTDVIFLFGCKAFVAVAAVSSWYHARRDIGNVGIVEWHRKRKHGYCELPNRTLNILVLCGVEIEHNVRSLHPHMYNFDKTWASLVSWYKKMKSGRKTANINIENLRRFSTVLRLIVQ